MGCRILAVAFVAALAAACTHGAARSTPTVTAPTPPPVTTATTLSPSPSPTEPLTTGPNVRPGERPPEYPALARQHTADGALAFARYYYAAFNWGYAINEPYLVRRISAPGCEGCAKYIAGLDSVGRSGAVLRGGQVRLRRSRLAHGHFNYASDYVVRVVLDEDAVVIDRPNGSRKLAAPALGNYIQYIFVSWLRRGWRVVELAGE